VYHRVDGVLLEYIFQEGRICNITFQKGIIGRVCYVVQVAQIARVGKRVKVKDMILRILRNKQTHYMRANKARASSDEYIHVSNFWLQS
jgi:hypothetical protein